MWGDTPNVVGESLNVAAVQTGKINADFYFTWPFQLAILLVDHTMAGYPTEQIGQPETKFRQKHSNETISLPVKMKYQLTMTPVKVN